MSTISPTSSAALGPVIACAAARTDRARTNALVDIVMVVVVEEAACEQRRQLAVHRAANRRPNTPLSRDPAAKHPTVASAFVYPRRQRATQGRVDISVGRRMMRPRFRCARNPAKRAPPTRDAPKRPPFEPSRNSTLCHVSSSARSDGTRDPSGMPTRSVCVPCPRHNTHATTLLRFGCSRHNHAKRPLPLCKPSSAPHGRFSFFLPYYSSW